MAEAEKKWYGLTESQIELYLSGGAQPGSVKHEQAKAAHQARLAEQERDRPSWLAIIGLIAAVVGAIAAVVALL